MCSMVRTSEPTPPDSAVDKGDDLMRIRTRRFRAALIALFPLTMLLVVLTPSTAQAVANS